MDKNIAVTGVGVVSPIAIGKDDFWQAQEQGKNGIGEISSFSTKDFNVHVAGEISNFSPSVFLELKDSNNFSRSTLLLLVASKLAIKDANVDINNLTTRDIGICTGTTFSHFSSIVQLDREVIFDGFRCANPALFPSTVLNAPSSHVSIKFNIQGFNTTLSTGYTSSLEALQYSMFALETGRAKIVFSSACEALSMPVFFGFHKLGYMAGLKGAALNCPFDRRRNGPLFGEGAVVLCIEDEANAINRNVSILAKIRSVDSFYESFHMGKINPKAKGLETVIRNVLKNAKLEPSQIDYISSCSNSSCDLDKIEVSVLKRIFGDNLNKIPVSSIKSMIGETISPSGNFQIISTIGAMIKGIIPPTINYLEKDPECDIDCVPNKSQKKDVKFALIISFGPGGYNSACILERGG